MASFTDAITQFNPYVAQLPVEVMAKVGMQKQAQYEEGYKKIQSQIDQVAGLDVLRDVDKNYLQTKLNSLGKDLRFHAASDFSNFQTVNAVGGMTKQISRDKNVQNAVSSTAWYRKQAQEMESAIKEGKSSQANIYDFNEKASAYMSSSDLNQSFSGRYTQYTDVKKKALDAIKMLHPQLQKYDIPFEIVNGQVVLDKQGKKVIADAMQRHKIEGIDEGQIKEAIAATLTPDDINQLSIDAKYQFRGTTPDALVQRATMNYESNKASAIDAIDLLNSKKKTTSDPTELANIDKNLEYYNSLVGAGERTGALQDQFAQNLKDARENPDAVKASIYKDGFVKELSNAFSWKNEEMEYVKNPIREQMNWVEDQKLEIQKENRARYEFGVTTGLRKDEIEISRQKLSLDAEANALKKAEIYGVDSPWTTIGNPTDTVLRSKEMLAEHSDSVANSIKAGRAELKTAGYSDYEINRMLNKQRDIPAKAMGTIEGILKQQSYLKSLKEKNDKIKADAKAEVMKDPVAAATLVKADNFAKSINGGKPIQIAPGVSLSAKEIGDKLMNGEALLQDIGYGNLAYTDVKTGKVTKISSQEGEKYVGHTAGSLFNNFQKILDYKNQKNVVYKKVDDLYKEKLAPLVSDFVPQIKALGADKDGSPTSATLGKVSALVTATMLRGTYADKDYDPTEASKMLSSENAKDTRIFIEQSGDNYHVILKSESDPKKLQRITLNRNDVVDNFGAQYVNTHVQESTRLKMGNGNTNVTGKPDGAIMQKAFGNFPGIRKMNIVADLDQDLSNRDLYVPTITIQKKDGNWQAFPLAGIDKLSRVGFDEGQTRLNALTDDVLLKYLKTQYPSFDYSQLDIK